MEKNESLSTVMGEGLAQGSAVMGDGRYHDLLGE
jgi:hypothetical protein